MFIRVKEFIEMHKDLINNDKFYELFEAAVEDHPSLATHEINELATILETTLKIEDLDTVRWKVFESQVKEYIDDGQEFSLKNTSNSWSRLDYMLNSVSTVGFEWSEAKEYIIKNGKNLGLTVRALDPEYGWYGAGDYDLGWFDQEKFAQENLYV